MKKENKSLSEKRLDMGLDYNPSWWLYTETDVKEFIKIVEELSYINSDGKRVVNLSDIKSKAGEKLI